MVVVRRGVAAMGLAIVLLTLLATSVLADEHLIDFQFGSPAQPLCIGDQASGIATGTVRRSATGPQYSNSAVLTFSLNSIVQPSNGTLSTVTFPDATVVLPNNWESQSSPYTAADTYQVGVRFVSSSAGDGVGQLILNDGLGNLVTVSVLTTTADCPTPTPTPTPTQTASPASSASASPASPAATPSAAPTGGAGLLPDTAANGGTSGWSVLAAMFVIACSVWTVSAAILARRRRLEG
jgi:hypothetical protein